MSTSSVKAAPPASLLSTPTPSRKQEHLDAGRRRLEKFREKKNAEKSKKAPVVSELHDKKSGVVTEVDEKKPPVVSDIDDRKSAEDAPGAVPAGGASTLVRGAETPPLSIGWSPIEGDHSEARDSSAGETAAARNGVGTGEKPIDVSNLSQPALVSSGSDPGLSSQTDEVDQTKLRDNLAGAGGAAARNGEGTNVRSIAVSKLDDKIIAEDGPDAVPAGGAGRFVRAVEKPALSIGWSPAEVDKGGARDGLAGGERAAARNGEIPIVVDNFAQHGFVSLGRDQGLSIQATASYPSVGNGYFTGLSSRSPSRKGDQHWQSSASMDDFSALEQHIEDLTQEKFSLQRGLAAANEVANQLAKEHSSLTENYNQQGKVVNQLREELARHHAEIKAQTLVIASLRAEREKAQHESALAIEQSKTLAAEVVALEERVLQVRSQGLKLERSLEYLTAENDQHKKQIISLEKDRANLKSMFDAVQEEKKMLATRLHRASKSQQAPPAQLSPVRMADACTSTDDMEALVQIFPAGSVSQTSLQGLFNRELSTAERHHLPEDSLASFSESPVLGDMSVPSTSAVDSSEVATLRAPITLRHGLQLPPLTSTIPDIHMESIQNISALIIELADDKAAIIRALTAESASAAELRLENMELRQKLEAQTQRLELVIAQSMAAHDGSVRQSNRAEAPSAGEGDGVLGWIKWLIPSRNSAASRRRYKRL